MIFITGGAYQGKLSYAKSNYGLSEDDIMDCANLELDMDRLCEKRCITNLHAIARNEESKTIDTFENFVGRLASLEKATGTEYILIMDEVGSGIVPLKRDDRDYRERAGRMGCLIAQYANTVIRVTCGIGQKIK